MKITYALISIVVLIALNSCDLRADCMACWKLKYVEIENYEGEISKGYIVWLDKWVNYSEHLYQKDYSQATEFCDTIAIYYSDTSDELILTKEIVFNQKIFGKTAIAVGNADTINLDEIRNIKAPNNKFNGYDGAGFIPRITIDQSILLNQREPNAVYKTAGWGLSDAYYLSFDATIREEELIVIAKNRTEESKFDGEVVLVEIHYD